MGGIGKAIGDLAKTESQLIRSIILTHEENMEYLQTRTIYEFVTIVVALGFIVNMRQRGRVRDAARLIEAVGQDGLRRGIRPVDIV